MKKNLQKGVSLYFAIFILIIIMAMVLGLATILIGQIKTLKGMGDSISALFAADSGMERILYLDNECRQANCTTTWPGLCTNDCAGFLGGYYATSSQWENTSYTATATTTVTTVIFKSLGVFEPTGTKRAFQATR